MLEKLFTLVCAGGVGIAYGLLIGNILFGRK